MGIYVTGREFLIPQESFIGRNPEPRTCTMRTQCQQKIPIYTLENKIFKAKIVFSLWKEFAM